MRCQNKNNVPTNKGTQVCVKRAGYTATELQNRQKFTFSVEKFTFTFFPVSTPRTIEFKLVEFGLFSFIVTNANAFVYGYSQL